MTRTRTVVATALAMALALTLSPVASAAVSQVAPKPNDPTKLVTPPSEYRVPPGHRLSGVQVIGIGDRVAKVAAALRGHSPISAAAYESGKSNWEVHWFDRSRTEIATAQISDTTGRVLEAWTGIQIDWGMARGYPGAFGRRVDALYVWLPLCLLFIAPFFDWRQPLRLLHLDLGMLLGFSVSLAFFNNAHIYASVPLAYPPLLYLLGRMLWIGLRGRDLGTLRLSVPATWLGTAAIFLIGFRAALNVIDSNVIDVGYVSALGASHVTSGAPLYGHFYASAVAGIDTYGPVTYEAYVPFNAVLGFNGRWGSVPSSHGASIAFDLLCIGLLFLIGRRIRGPTLGAALAYAWAAYPFTLFTMNSNSNDALVAALLLGAVAVASSAPARGAMVALGALTKFAPLAVAPLMATHGLRDEPRRLRALALFALAFAAAALIALWPVFAHSSLAEMWKRTVVNQTNRISIFSVWGLYGGLGWVQTAVQVAAAALALALAFVRRREDVVGLAALTAAIVIAVQLGVTHWFYLYIPWFFGLAMVALLCRYTEPAAERPAIGVGHGA